MDLKKKLAEIIPPNQTQYRREFYNTPIIDALTDDEKIEIEQGLIDMLYRMPSDLLIVQTLDYMKSTKAIQAMKNALDKCNNQLQRIILARSIFKIDQDYKMIDIAMDSFIRLNNKWDLVFCFDYLSTFKSDMINAEIKKYINHDDFLISHNAKKALGLIT